MESALALCFFTLLLFVSSSLSSEDNEEIEEIDLQRLFSSNFLDEVEGTVIQSRRAMAQDCRRFGVEDEDFFFSKYGGKECLEVHIAPVDEQIALYSSIRLVLKMFDNSNNTKEYYKNCWGTHGWKSIQLLYFEDVTNASEYINGGVDADEQRLLMFDPLQKAMIGFSQRHRLPLQRKTFSLSFRHTRFFVFMFVQGKEFQRSPLLSPNKIISYATEFCHQLQPPSTVKVEEEANANETPSTSFNLIDVLVTALSPSNVISIHNMLKCVLVVSGVVLVAGSLPSLMTTIINWMQTKPMSGKVKATTGNNNTMQDEGTLQQQTDDLIMKLKDELETEVKERDMGGERDTTLSVPDKHKHTNNINNINNINNKEKDKDMNNKGKDKCEADGIRTRKKKKKRGRKYSSSLQRRSRTTSETIEDNSSNECNRKKGGVQRDPVNAVGSKHSNNNNNNNKRNTNTPNNGSREKNMHNNNDKRKGARMNNKNISNKAKTQIQKDHILSIDKINSNHNPINNNSGNINNDNKIKHNNMTTDELIHVLNPAAKEFVPASVRNENNRYNNGNSKKRSKSESDTLFLQQTHIQFFNQQQQQQQDVDEDEYVYNDGSELSDIFETPPMSPMQQHVYSPTLYAHSPPHPMFYDLCSQHQIPLQPHSQSQGYAHTESLSSPEYQLRHSPYPIPSQQTYNKVVEMQRSPFDHHHNLPMYANAAATTLFYSPPSSPLHDVPLQPHNASSLSPLSSPTRHVQHHHRGRSSSLSKSISQSSLHSLIHKSNNDEYKSRHSDHGDALCLEMKKHKKEQEEEEELEDVLLTDQCDQHQQKGCAKDEVCHKNEDGKEGKEWLGKGEQIVISDVDRTNPKCIFSHRHYIHTTDHNVKESFNQSITNSQLQQQEHKELVFQQGAVYYQHAYNVKLSFTNTHKQ
eukprot:m.127795 g.127795  ORF g.127795 m.127795 type:complete len:919 (-) comp13014_c7_seq2:146-2902(-)